MLEKGVFKAQSLITAGRVCVRPVKKGGRVCVRVTNYEPDLFSYLLRRARLRYGYKKACSRSVSKGRAIFLVRDGYVCVN